MIIPGIIVYLTHYNYVLNLSTLKDHRKAKIICLYNVIHKLVYNTLYATYLQPALRYTHGHSEIHLIIEAAKYSYFDQ